MNFREIILHEKAGLQGLRITLFLLSFVEAEFQSSPDWLQTHDLLVSDSRVL